MFSLMPRSHYEPDTIVPEPFNSQSFNRYSYVVNNPLKYTDPSGYNATLITEFDMQTFNVFPPFGLLEISSPIGLSSAPALLGPPAPFQGALPTFGPGYGSFNPLSAASFNFIGQGLGPPSNVDVYVRAYAPAVSFGFGFGGDTRTTPSISSTASSRIFGRTRINMFTRGIVGTDYGTSGTRCVADPCLEIFGNKEADAIVYNNSSIVDGLLIMHVYGNNPFFRFRGADFAPALAGC